MPVPFFFQRNTAKAFRSMNVLEDDVILSSLPKGGTTWMHKILFLMMHGLDDNGQMKNEAKDSLGSKNQIYPEALVLNRGEPTDSEITPQMDELRKQFFGEYGFEDDLLGQPSPRLISTHLYGEYLPEELSQRGRLIIVLRNLKDTLCSLHFFRGEAADGWTGNEKGPGSFARFIDPKSPNAYGSAFNFVKENDILYSQLQDDNRVLVV